MKTCTYLAIGLAALTVSASAIAGPYITEQNIMIPTNDGATICAVVVRPQSPARLSSALEFTIYVDPEKNLPRLEYAAERGYAGVMAYTRGKACSPQQIVPYEHDGQDANSVIEWIAKQPWSDGNVGMMGGSYDGFTQWSAAKNPNPHLKTIAPVVPNNPGNGLPLQNNIFQLANYAWIYYATNNKTLDYDTYKDPKWRSLPERWYSRGLSYAEIDRIAGVPNPWLHKWQQHPSYDAYWQAMSPYRGDYARISFPVLTIMGYYGDSTAIGYLRDFHRYNPTAQSYLVAGPWDHFGSQARDKPKNLRGYKIDPAAQIDTWKLTFDWFDFVMGGKPRPALIQDHINVEVMGEDRWRHAGTLEELGRPERFYLTTKPVTPHAYLLSNAPAQSPAALHQTVVLSDRTSMSNDSYPSPIVGKQLDRTDGYTFLTPPFHHAQEVSGLDGAIHLRVNKRDLDVGLALYELLPDGQLIQLTYHTQRASFAADPSERHLLTPGIETEIPFEQGYFFSRLVAKGSRLLLTLNVNKNAFAQINYGTGKDVSSEDIHDADVPMKVDWLTSSFIQLRLQDPRALDAK